MNRATPYQTDQSRTQHTGHTFWLYLVLLAAGIGWGLSIALATVAVSSGKDPIAVTFWSALCSLVLLSGWLFLRKTRPPMTPDHLRFYVVTGILGTVIPHILAFYAAAHLPAGLRSVVFALIPMMTLLLSLGLSLEKPNLRRFVGLVLGVTAIALLFHLDVTNSDTSHAFWILVSMIVVVSYAFENVFIRLKRPPDLNLIAALWGMTLAAVATLFVMIGIADVNYGSIDVWDRADAAIFLMSIVHIVCYGGFIFLIGQAGSVFASQVSYVVTPAGVIWGTVILGEQLSPTIILSTGIIMAGLILIQPRSG